MAVFGATASTDAQQRKVGSPPNLAACWRGVERQVSAAVPAIGEFAEITAGMNLLSHALRVRRSPSAGGQTGSVEHAEGYRTGGGPPCPRRFGASGCSTLIWWSRASRGRDWDASHSSVEWRVASEATTPDPREAGG